MGLLFLCYRVSSSPHPSGEDKLEHVQQTVVSVVLDSPGKNTRVGCHVLLQCMEVKSESEVAQLCPTLCDPWTTAYQAPLSMGFSRQEYWRGVPLPSPAEPSEVPLEAYKSHE